MDPGPPFTEDPSLRGLIADWAVDPIAPPPVSSRAPGAGRQYAARNAPTLINTALGLEALFWDSRLTVAAPGTSILAAQATVPVLNRREMRGDSGDRDVHGEPNELALLPDGDGAAAWDAIMDRLLAIPKYRTLFAAAFPGTLPEALTYQDAARAIAAFEATLTFIDSPFERYVRGDDAALTSAQKRGAMLFFSTARCAGCHNGPLLGGKNAANVGVPQIGPGTVAAAPLDTGRDSFAFRVAPLRNVELTAPYFHDGAYATLERVVEHYNDVAAALYSYTAANVAPALAGMIHDDATTLGRVMATLDFRVATDIGLAAGQQADIVAFLKSLTDPAARDLRALRPAAVPSGLAVP